MRRNKNNIRSEEIAVDRHPLRIGYVQIHSDTFVM